MLSNITAPRLGRRLGNAADSNIENDAVITFLFYIPLELQKKNNPFLTYWAKKIFGYS